MRHPSTPEHIRAITAPRVNEEERFLRWVTWLGREDIPPRRQLLTVIRSGQLPAHLLHTFACDCADAALVRLQRTQLDATKLLLELLAKKRAWIEGQCSAHEVEQALAVVRPLHTQPQHAFVRNVIERVMSAASLHPEAAARYASRSETSSEAEATRQRQVLKDRLLHYVYLRRRLLDLLATQEQIRQGNLNTWHRRFEDLLFERK